MEALLQVRRRWAALVAVLALAAGLLAVDIGTAHAQGVAPSGGPYLYDALAQFTAITTRPEAMGWFPSPDGEGPNPTHVQALAGGRPLAGAGAAVPVRDAAAATTPARCPGADDDPSGDLSIVRFDSRDQTGERWRSNRLPRDTDIVDTAPPAATDA